MRSVKGKYLYIFIFFILFLIFINDKVVVDSILYIDISPISAFRSLFLSWSSDLVLGHSNSWNHSYIFPFSFLYYLFFLIFGNIYITQALVFASILFFIFFSSITFIKDELRCGYVPAAVGALFYTFNLYTLTSFAGASVMLLSFGALPLQLYFLRKVFSEEDYFRHIIGFAFATLLMSGINPPLVAINLLVLLSYLVYLFFDGLRLNKEFIKRGGVLSLVVILMNAYWIIGISSFFLAGSADMEAILSEPLSMQNAQGTYLNVFRTLGLWSFGGGWMGVPYYNYSTTYLENVFFQFSLFFPVIISIVSLVVLRKNEKRRERSGNAVFFWAMLLVLVSIPMVVGTKEGAFSVLYEWAYGHIPLFSMFRSSYKFIQVYILGLSILIVYFLNILNDKRRRAAILILAFVVLVNAFPFFSGKIFESGKKIPSIPEYYYEAGNFFRADEDSYRILLLPPQYFSVFTWGNTAGNPEIIWNKGLVARQPGSSEERSNKLTIELYDALFSGKYDQAMALLNILNVKYIVQRNDYDWKFYESISKSPSEVADALIGRFDKVASFGALDVYIVPEDVRGSIVSSSGDVNIVFENKSPVEKRLIVRNLKGTRDIDFFESFDSSWFLYLNEYNDSSCDDSDVSVSKNEKFAERNNEERAPFIVSSLGYLWRDSIFAESHGIAREYANSWTVDSEYIKRNFDRSFYKENVDGSIDVDLTFYFKPQSYFYVGLIISGLTLFGSLGYLGWHAIRGRFLLRKIKEK